MVDINNAFPSAYIKADDLQGRDCQVTISHVRSEDIGSGEHKLVVFFLGKERGLVLNKTNANTIATVTGATDTDMWCNKSIILFPTQTDFQGRQVPCIRVRLTRPVQQTPFPPHQAPPNQAQVEDLNNQAMGGGSLNDVGDIPFGPEWR